MPHLRVVDAAWTETEPIPLTPAARQAASDIHQSRYRLRRRRIREGRCVACGLPRSGAHSTAVHCPPCAADANAAAEPARARVDAIRATAGLPPLPS